MLEMCNSVFAQTGALPVQVAHSFLSDRPDGGDGVWCNQFEEPRPLPLVLPLYVHPLAPGQEQLRILLISSPSWVNEVIHDLHRRNFANAKDWSSLVPGANPGEVVSILTRRRQRL